MGAADPWRRTRAVYDQAALRAIADATPFPPLPDQYKSSILKIHLGFSPVSDRG